MEIGWLRSITFLSHYQWLWPSHEQINTHNFNFQLFFMDCYHQELCVISGFHCGVNEIFALGSFSPTPTINSLPLKTGSSILTFTDLKEFSYLMIVQLWSSWGHIFYWHELLPYRWSCVLNYFFALYAITLVTVLFFSFLSHSVLGWWLMI